MKFLSTGTVRNLVGGGYQPSMDSESRKSLVLPLIPPGTIQDDDPNLSLGTRQTKLEEDQDSIGNNGNGSDDDDAPDVRGGKQFTIKLAKGKKDIVIHNIGLEYTLQYITLHCITLPLHYPSIALPSIPLPSIPFPSITSS